MTRNIEINYLNSSGYDLLFPKTIDSNTEVDAIIKEILSLPESDMLDDVLLNMVLPDNKYAVALTVKTPGGRPFNGASVSGITSYVGEALTTDENGYVLGFCDTSTPTVTVTNPFLDVSGNVAQQLNLSGKVINTAEMKAVRGSITQITYDSGSRVVRFSQDVEEFDCSAVGGGQNGQDGRSSGSGRRGSAWGGNGGNAGAVQNASSLKNTNNSFTVVVGGVGGTSSVEGYLTAAGGGGAKGGTGAYVSKVHNQQATTRDATPAESTTTNFLYPPTSVGGGGAGDGANVEVGTDSSSSSASANASTAGSPGGGGPGQNATAIGGGGGGGRGIFSVHNAPDYDESRSGGSGQPGLVGFMWRYKPDL